MILLEFCCGRPIPPEPAGCVFNHPVVMSNFIWAVVILVFLLVLGIKIINLIKEKNDSKQKEAEAARKHELKLKEDAFEREKFWAFYKMMEDPLKDKLDKAEKEVEELKKRKKEIEDGESKLEKEKADQEKKILEEKIKVYQEIIKEIK